MSNYPVEHFFRTVQNIETHLLEQQGHGTVVRTPRGIEETGFLCELAAHGKLFFLRIRVDEPLGFVLCDLYPTLKFSEEKQKELAQWCVQQTTQWKVGSIQLDLARGTIFAHVEATFRDGAISRDTMAHIEQLLLSLLLPHYGQLTDLAEDVTQQEK